MPVPDKTDFRRNTPNSEPEPLPVSPRPQRPATALQEDGANCPPRRQQCGCHIQMATCVMDTGQQTQLEGVMFLSWQRIQKLQTVTAGPGGDTARPTLSRFQASSAVPAETRAPGTALPRGGSMLPGERNFVIVKLPLKFWRLRLLLGTSVELTWDPLNKIMSASCIWQN